MKPYGIVAYHTAYQRCRRLPRSRGAVDTQHRSRQRLRRKALRDKNARVLALPGAAQLLLLSSEQPPLRTHSPERRAGRFTRAAACWAQPRSCCIAPSGFFSKKRTKHRETELEDG